MKNSCEPVIFADSFQTEKNKRRDIIYSIINNIQNTGYPLPYDDMTLELLIDEVITNAMEHGNEWNPSRCINVSLYEDKKNLCLSVEDEGIGFDVQSRCTISPHMKIRGRGLQILTSLAKISWNQKGNRITICLTEG